MLQLGDEVSLYSVVFVVVLLATRSPTCSGVLTGCLYLFLAMFRFPQLPAGRARQVLHSAGSGKVSVIAHRGGGHDAPENTIAAIRLARKNGASGVELDLEFSADGVAILMHDESVDRTTNGSGLLSQMKFADLGKLDAAAKHRLREKFAGEKIPTLTQAVDECIKLKLSIYFDVKGHPDKAAAALSALYKTHPILYNSSIVCSFEPKVIYKALELEPLRRRLPTLQVTMEAPLADANGYCVGLGPPSLAVEAVRHFCISGAKELCLTGLCAILEPERGGSGCLDCKQRC
ncbi:glycerophosphodiester phosphodiesterase 1 isoform X2 [Stigmatopora nigra]